MILRALNIALLSIWTFFLLWLLSFGKGDLTRLLHPRLWWILGLAAFVLILFIFSYIAGKEDEKSKSVLNELPGMLILLVPVLFFSLAKDARLDTQSLQHRLIKNEKGEYINNFPFFDTSDVSQSDKLSFSKLLRNPGKYENQDVEVVCQSFSSDELPKNTAMCYRYLITCCAADALPAFIFLSHQDELKIENDKWIKVNGPLSVIRKQDMSFPSVQVESLEYVDEPDFPWAM